MLLCKIQFLFLNDLFNSLISVTAPIIFSHFKWTISECSKDREAFNQQGNADKHHRSKNSFSGSKILHRFCEKEEMSTPLWKEPPTCWKTLQDQRQHGPYLWKVHLEHWSEIHSFWHQDNLKWGKISLLLFALF